jgi:hypothetical protein
MPINTQRRKRVNDQEIRAKSLELAILTFDNHLDLFGTKPATVNSAQSDNVLFDWADTIARYLQKPL